MSIDEMSKFVSDYIYHRTGERVQVSPKAGEEMKLIKAFNIAVRWFRDNEI